MNWVKLIVSIVVCQLAGVIGSFFTTPAITGWYSGLVKPWFTPPNWLFAPVWITLYLLMGIAAYWVWDSGLDNKRVRTALMVFDIQLILNVIWSLLFFGLQNPLYGLVWIVILWVAIAATIILFYRLSRRAGLILLPYIAWVTVAMFLNLYIWLLN